jgi:RimJ/RimL family protein N-acetyltransferase
MIVDPAAWTPRPPPGTGAEDGRHVRLEPLAPGHAAALHAAFAGQDALWAFMAYGPFDAPAYAAWVAAQAGRADPAFFAILPHGAGPQGVAALLRIDRAMGTAEIGHICLAPALQRCSAATEAIAILARRVFALGYRRLEWKCDARNAASCRAALRLGFAHEGMFRRHMVVKGQNRDTAWFAITDADWHGGLAGIIEGWLEPANFDPQGRQRRRLSTLTAAWRTARERAGQAGQTAGGQTAGG